MRYCGAIRKIYFFNLVHQKIMQLKFFNIPINTNTEDEEQVNKFLRSVKILEIKRDLIILENSASWAICVSYLPNGLSNYTPMPTRGKVDYKNELSESEFRKFSVLRKIRKQIADDDAVPAYAVFTDSELAEIVRLEKIETLALQKIKGVGLKKIEKYGKKLCDIYSKVNSDEEIGKPD